MGLVRRKRLAEEGRDCAGGAHEQIAAARTEFRSHRCEAICRAIDRNVALCVPNHDGMRVDRVARQQRLVGVDGERPERRRDPVAADDLMAGSARDGSTGGRNPRFSREVVFAHAMSAHHVYERLSGRAFG